MTVSHPPKHMPVWMEKGVAKASPIKSALDTRASLLPPLADAMWVVTVPIVRGAHELRLQGALKPKGKTGQSHDSPFLLAQPLQKGCRASYCHCYFLHRSMWRLWLFGYHISCQCFQLAVKMLETYNG